MTPTVGVAGIGRMGTALARNIAASGHPTVLYNRTGEKAADLAGEVGAVVAATPADLARQADVVITMLRDGPALRAVYDGADGVLAGLRPGAIAVDMSTVGPALVRELGARVAAEGAAMVDAPVAGVVAAAEARALLIMVGGAEADVGRVRPVLDLLGDRIHHLGPLGAGAAMKLAVNTVVYGLNQSLSEALVMAERAGIDRSAAYAVFAVSTVAAPAVHYRRKVFEHPGGPALTFDILGCETDVRLALELADAVGALLPQAQLNLEIMQDAERAGFGAADIGEVAEHLRRLAAGSSEDV